MAAAFLRSGADTLAFLDADIGIRGDDFVKLVRLDKPIRGAAVNVKTLDHAESLSVYKDGRRLTRREMLETETLDGTVDVDYLGGSVMLIERDVVDILVRKHSELLYTDPITGEGCHLFHEIVEDGFLLSEDYAFCQRARHAGFTIGCDPTVIVSHFEGRTAWRF